MTSSLTDTVWNSIRNFQHWFVRHITATYIPGPHLADGINLARKIAERGWCSTICYWNGSEDLPESINAEYQRALNSIIHNDLDCYLSIKVPALQYSFARLKLLLETAREHRIRIHFDAQHFDSAAPSLKLLERAAKLYTNLGYTLPSRWLRSIRDVETIVDLGIAVRIVKGQWPDPDKPELDARKHFMELVEALAGRAVHVAVATHDTALAKAALSRLHETETPCQLEQLFGLPIRDESAAKCFDITTRVYIPYGNAYLPYALSQVFSRPIIIGWIMRDFLLGRNKRLL